ncbi:MAG: alkyl hydroperoxide reductase/Thiol specific antioxidant/Mal allergen [Marmoricola sp.]|nr:alkyl hydroperoxide reductase/Thiol specific antioxidant/Mal allergen [Marmoricola sp.]
MITLGLIGLVGGLIAGISPCILPVLPIIFMSSSAAAGAGSDEHGVAHDAESRPDLTPFLVVAGLAVSFSVFTLLGTLALNALPLPSDFIRWAGLVALLALGIGMIVPAVERIIERPFARFSGGAGTGNRRGFVLGLALGAVYVPCAGPVLAAITVAGATGKIGGDTIVLTIAFALGTSIPLLAFALAGRRVSERVRAFRTRQRGLRVAAGVVVIGLAVALTFNLSDAIQRAVPDYTSALDKAADTSARIHDAIGNEQSKSLSACVNAQVPATSLENCGPAPKFAGIAHWFNTADNKPLTAADLKGKVVLVDFWAYSCINCQRAIPHVEAWYQRYKKDGLVVVGVHTPEYAFEHDLGNVESGAKRLGITYPVALDNDYGTWNNFGNDSWPAEYLVDANGVIRHVAIGEGDYGGTEKLIRSLLKGSDTAKALPSATNLPDTTPQHAQSQETYLGSERGKQFYTGKPALTNGTHAFTFPANIGDNQFTLEGPWKVAAQDLTAGTGAKLALSFTGNKVYLDAGGTGTLTVHADGKTKTFNVSGAPDIYTVIDLAETARGVVEIDVSPGLQVYSFTFG